MKNSNKTLEYTDDNTKYSINWITLIWHNFILRTTFGKTSFGMVWLSQSFPCHHQVLYWLRPTYTQTNTPTLTKLFLFFCETFYLVKLHLANFISQNFTCKTFIRQDFIWQTSFGKSSCGKTSFGMDWLCQSFPWLCQVLHYANGYRLYWERERERESVTVTKWHLGIIIYRLLSRNSRNSCKKGWFGNQQARYVYNIILNPRNENKCMLQIWSWECTVLLC